MHIYIYIHHIYIYIYIHVYIYRLKWVMIKILGVKIIWSVRSDVWCGDVVSFSVACR
jgi:hypothetical protein